MVAEANQMSQELNKVTVSDSAQMFFFFPMVSRDHGYVFKMNRHLLSDVCLFAGGGVQAGDQEFGSVGFKRSRSGERDCCQGHVNGEKTGRSPALFLSLCLSFS